jgi:gluconolactonase
MSNLNDSADVPSPHGRWGGSIVTLAEGLAFPEGPVVTADGGIIVAEIAIGQVSLIKTNGVRTVIARLGGGPNGLAPAPKGRLLVCNNGGCFTWNRSPTGLLTPGRRSPDYDGGRIELLDPDTGKWERLFDRADGYPLLAPNDLVCDSQGGMWFSDHGLPDHQPQDVEREGIVYASLDGRYIRHAWHLESPNGVGLSPDGRTLYAANKRKDIHAI